MGKVCIVSIALISTWCLIGVILHKNTVIETLENKVVAPTMAQCTTLIFKELEENNEGFLRSASLPIKGVKR
jgi:hypothetical protein